MSIQNQNSSSVENLREINESDQVKESNSAALISDDHEYSYNKNDENQSFGMKLGQIQNKSISLMNEIICLEPTVQEISLLQEVPEDSEELPPTSNETEHNDKNNEIKADAEPTRLFGRLSELDEDITGGIVYQPLLTGIISLTNDLSEIKRKLRVIADICIEYLWIDETAYLNELIEAANYFLGNNANNQNNENNESFAPNNYNNSNFRKTGFRRQNPKEEIEKIYNKMDEDFKTNFDKEIEKLNNRRIEELNKIDEEYSIESAKLDEKYQDPSFLSLLPFSKPSKELLDMRYKATRLLKQNRINEATELTNKIKQKEKTEANENSIKLREKYYADDRRLKEQFAVKRHNAELKFKLEESRINNRKRKQTEMYENTISKLKRQIDRDDEYLEQNQTKNQNEKTLNDNDPNGNNFNNLANTRMVKPRTYTTNNIDNSPFLKYGQIEPKAPKMLNRSSDIMILEKMTEELLNNAASSPRKSNINKIFKQQTKGKK